MKIIFVMTLLLSVTTLSAATTPVSAESFMSEGMLFFKLENYSKDTGYDCVISYDLRTYDDEHSYVRTAANLQTKIIYIDKKSILKIKADFQLQENEKIADLAHAVKAPNCVPAFRSRAVLLKDYYSFNNYVEPFKEIGYLDMFKKKGLVLKANFQDITQFEISSFKEVDLGNDLYVTFNPDPESRKMFSNGFQLFFINDVQRNIMIINNQLDMLADVLNSSSSIQVYYNKLNKIEKYNLPDGQGCGVVLSSDYLICGDEELDGLPVLFNPKNKEIIKFDETGMEVFEDSSERAKCNVNMGVSLVTEGKTTRFSNRCTTKNNELLRFDVFVDTYKNNNHTFLKATSYGAVNEEKMKIEDIKKEFPWTPFIAAKAKDSYKDRFIVSEKLDDVVNRLFKKTPSNVNVINTGKEEYFDIFFNDANNDGYFGRIYWNEIK